MIAIDDHLRTGRRGLRTRPGTLLLGPTGARLWADYLEDAPGFLGAIDFIHKLNIPLLFTVTHDVAAPPVPSEVEWRPSHLRARRSFGPLHLEERKYVTWDDVAVSIQRWRNDGREPALLRLKLDESWLSAAERQARGERRFDAHGFTLRALLDASLPELWTGLHLAPGQEIECVVAAALGLAETDEWGVLSGKVDEALAASPAALLERQVEDYQDWFNGAPSFTSSSPVLDKVFAYRWYIMRKTLARPGIGELDGTIFYEGRSHKMTKAPWEPVGWEFSKLIPLSSPMHLLECRWHQDTTLGTELFPVLAKAQGADGQFQSRTLTTLMHPYANFMGWAAYQFALARGVTDALVAALPMLKNQVLGEAEFLATGGDNLPIQQRHQLTGKEYQPSYWYFHHYPDDPFDHATYTPLKRVGRAIYQHLNAKGVAALCALVGDADSERFGKLADAVAADVLSKQWDESTAFFYDLHHQTDEKAMVRNVVGLYPYWAGLTGPEHLKGFETVLGPDHFGTPNPLPSVSPECPVFQPGGGWKGRFFKGRNGCMWDGPTWPYTNSIAIDAIGGVSRRNGHAYDGTFADYFWKYTLLHFHQRDGETPYLVEHYDSLSGEPISDEPDYNHSYFIDLVIRHVVGLEVTAEGLLSIDPIDIGLGHFALENVPVRGRNLAIRFGAESGMSLSIDGEEVARRETLGSLTHQLVA